MLFSLTFGPSRPFSPGGPMSPGKPCHDQLTDFKLASLKETHTFNTAMKV